MTLSQFFGSKCGYLFSSSTLAKTCTPVSDGVPGFSDRQAGSQARMMGRGGNHWSRNDDSSNSHSHSQGDHDDEEDHEHDHEHEGGGGDDDDDRVDGFPKGWDDASDAPSDDHSGDHDDDDSQSASGSAVDDGGGLEQLLAGPTVTGYAAFCTAPNIGYSAILSVTQVSWCGVQVWPVFPLLSSQL